MKEETKYIFSKGDLSQKDFSIKFKNDTGNVYLPIKNVKELYCFNEVTLSSKLLELFSKSGVILHFYGYYENYIGTFYPNDHYLSGKLTIAQAQAYTDKRMDIARVIVLGISKNIHSTMYHYYRHDKKELKSFLDWLKSDCPVHISNTRDIKQLLSVEGQIWAMFYQNIRFVVPDAFIITKRVRRPPDNPMNALISFGNSLLYTKTITQIYRTHLNQTISFLHEPSEKRFSLSLDLSEVFKPIIVFKTIFECINNRRIQTDKHFDKSLNYAMLNEDGKRIFIEAFENRLNLTFQHSGLKRKISYKQAIRLDAYKLIKFIMEGKPFIPFDFEANR